MRKNSGLDGTCNGEYNQDDCVDHSVVNRRGQATSRDLEISAIGGYDDDSGVEGYLMGHDATGAYRDLKPEIDPNVYKAAGKTNLFRQFKGIRERPYKIFPSKLNIPIGKSRFKKTRTDFPT